MRRGPSLWPMNEPYSDELRKALGPERPVRLLPVTASTNEDALAWATGGEPAPEGAVVVADQQTAGRGRWGREWASAPGRALMFSLVLRPQALELERLGLLTSAMGLACADAIADLMPLAPTLKWPNDVNIRSRKVAGILFESQLMGSSASVVIAGVGVNTHWSVTEIPEELRDRATSLGIEGEPPGRAELLAAILERFEPLYRGVVDGDGVAALIRRADELSDIKGQGVEVTLPDGRLERAVAGGLAPSGALEVEVDGRRRLVDVGEVTRIRSAG
jgi:BirA family biotin operon repressor/biotin-[acetyl-CoA-carboxylase] ligase